jgi:hypothetical protein
MGSAFTVNMPARQSLMGELVPRHLLHSATALHVASMNLNRIAGPATAGASMAAIGPLPVLLINLVTNSWTVRQILEMRYRPTRPPKPSRSRAGSFLEGFHYCWQNRELRATLVTVAVYSFFGLSYVQLLPSLARDTLRVGPDGLGLLTASMGGGALLGSLLLARQTGLPRKGLVLGLAATGLGLLLLLLGRVDQLPLAIGLLGLIGALSSLLTATGIAAIQEQVSDELSGRVFGVYMLTMGMMPLGSLPAGALATQLDTATALSIWGSICALLSGLLLGVRSLNGRVPGPESRVPSVEC